MPRLIDADELYVDARCGENEEPYISLYQINDAPTVDVESLITKHEDIGYEKGYRDGYAEALEATDDAEPVRHGQWIKNEDRSGWHCSCCGTDDLYAYSYAEYNERELQDFYCPNCGVKIDEVKDG